MQYIHISLVWKVIFLPAPQNEFMSADDFVFPFLISNFDGHTA